MTTEATRARDLMSSPVHSLPKSSTILEAARFLLEHRLTGAPVVDSRGLPVGVFSLRDLAKFFLDPLFMQPEARTGLPPEPAAVGIADFMTTHVVTVRPEATIEECRRAMRQHKMHRVVVVDAQGRLAGVVSATDLALRETAE